MKKVTKQIQKNIEVTVCDICESTDTCISWEWNTHCPYDDCTWDYGEANFCSFKHFLEGIKLGKLELNSKEDFSQQSFTLSMEGEGTSELTDFLEALNK